MNKNIFMKKISLLLCATAIISLPSLASGAQEERDVQIDNELAPHLLVPLRCLVRDYADERTFKKQLDQANIHVMKLQVLMRNGTTCALHINGSITMDAIRSILTAEAKLAPQHQCLWRNVGEDKLTIAHEIQTTADFDFQKKEADPLYLKEKDVNVPCGEDNVSAYPKLAIERQMHYSVLLSGDYFPGSGHLAGHA